MVPPAPNGPTLHLNGFPHEFEEGKVFTPRANVTVHLADGSRDAHVSTDIEDGRIYAYTMYSLGQAGELLIWEGQESAEYGYDVVDAEVVRTYAAGWWRSVAGTRRGPEEEPASAEEEEAWTPPVTPMAAPPAVSPAVTDAAPEVPSEAPWPFSWANATQPDPGSPEPSAEVPVGSTVEDPPSALSVPITPTAVFRDDESWEQTASVADSTTADRSSWWSQRVTRTPGRDSRDTKTEESSTSWRPTPWPGATEHAGPFSASDQETSPALSDELPSDPR